MLTLKQFSRRPTMILQCCIFFMLVDLAAAVRLLYKYLYYHLAAQNMNCVCTTWTNIAANKLPHGATVHSIFTLLVPITENSSCRTAPKSVKEAFIRTVCFFFNSEVSNTSKPAFEAIDRCFKDITGNYQTPVCASTFLFGDSDFVQTLPLSDLAAPIDYCVLRSWLWEAESYFILRQFSERPFSGWCCLACDSNTKKQPLSHS